jgi:hypothetical protein
MRRLVKNLALLLLFCALVLLAITGPSRGEEELGRPQVNHCGDTTKWKPGAAYKKLYVKAQLDTECKIKVTVTCNKDGPLPSKDLKRGDPSRFDCSKKDGVKDAEIVCDAKGDDQTCRYRLNPEKK